ncbi:hypothetical protein PISL3812_00112 [Talaromyces islandicus]|uniref:Enoyl reductase (ER) domain-containing protein n=1 Tax=Talaromyces islandicus TaxID=28573 RepID=A0A0U1LK28_TALIS|nr:hypothetical protein PISL3812_00112 [Talaromyces islandicus]
MSLPQKTLPKIPRLQRALVATGPGSLALKAVAVPRIAVDEVLVRTAAVALNPSDHKLLDQSTTAGAISGSDFAGVVVHVGSSVQDRMSVGDRVFGIVFGANPGRPGNGAFAQYVAAPADLCMHVPDGMDMATAASMGMGLMTTGLALRSLGLRWDRLAEQNDDSDDDRHNPYVLVHGGATATGTIAIQILRQAGYLPVATCSPTNFDLVTDRGAVAGFDYNSASCANDIRRYTKGRLHYALDCIGNEATMILCYCALGDGASYYTTLEQYSRRLTIRRRDVTPDWILGWTLLGDEVQLAGAYYREARPDDRQFGRDWAVLMESLLEQARVRPHPIEATSQGALMAVVPRLDLLRKKMVKGKKIVVKV